MVSYIYNYIYNMSMTRTLSLFGDHSGPRRSQLHHCAARCGVRQAQVAPAADVREVCAVQETDLGGTWQLFGSNKSNVGKTVPSTSHLGMVYTTYKNGDDWGMVYYCSTHILQY